MKTVSAGLQSRPANQLPAALPRGTVAVGGATRPVAVPAPAAASARPAARNARSVVLRSAPISSTPASVSTAFDIPAPPLGNDVLEVPNIRGSLKPRNSPFVVHNNFGGGFVSDGDSVALNSVKFASVRSSGADGGGSEMDSQHMAHLSMDSQTFGALPPWALRAGAREKIYFDPKQVTAAVVTCGGLCPGLNDVVQGVVNKLQDYGVPEGNILGIRYGFRGFYDKAARPVVLTKRVVEGIQMQGGTILGTSRGGADIREIVKRIDMWGIDMLFVVGGNGGNAGANAINEECRKLGVNCCVIGVPKSIDNDILLIDRTFGFDTAVEEAQRALLAAKVEASSARKGLGLVKLMGRQSGFIAMQASLASGVVDACLIPEVRFDTQGPHGLFAYIDKLLSEKGHCVVCVAEGAGQELMELSNGNGATDASGNPILKDIGTFMKGELKKAFPDADIKYIDPSYMIRSVATSSNDRIYCKILAHNAVHAAFAGYTGTTVGLVNTHYCYLPIPVVIQAPRTIDPRGKMWNRLRNSIGQPDFTEPSASGRMSPERGC